MAEAHDTHAHAESPRFYWMVAGILAVITIVEVVVTFIPMPQLLLLAILMILAVVKGAGVVMFFMHLRGDARVFQFLFLVPLVMASSMIIAFLALFSNHVGIGG